MDQALRQEQCNDVIEEIAAAFGGSDVVLLQGDPAIVQALVSGSLMAPMDRPVLTLDGLDSDRFKLDHRSQLRFSVICFA